MISRDFILHSVFLAMIMSIVTLQPYFMHGAINFYETGIYLPQINELLHGLALYRDIFILRGPLEIFMPAYLMKFFGMHMGVLSAYFYFGTVLTLFIYMLFSLKLFRTRGFVYLFSLVLIARCFPWSCYNVWGGIRFGLGISGILLAVSFLKNKRPIWLFFAGVLTSLAFWTSFELGAFSFISIMAALLLSGYLEAKDRGGIFRHILIYIAGNAAASFPFIFYLISHGALSSYVEGGFIVLTKMTHVFDPTLSFETPANLKEFIMALSPLNHNFKYTLPFLFYIALGAYLFRRFVKGKFDVYCVSILSLGIYGALLYKGAFRDIEGPQYRMALEPLLLIMFFYLERAYIWIKNVKDKALGLKKALAIFILFIIPFYALGFSASKFSKRFFIFKELKQIILYARHAEIPYAVPNPEPLKTFRARGILVPSAQAKEIDAVVEYIASNTKERENIFTFPDLGTYNFLADRPSVGRFYSAEFSFMDQKYFEEMFREVKNTRPRFVIESKDFSRLEQFRPTLGKYLDEVNSYLKENYEVAVSYSAVNILRRK